MDWSERYKCEYNRREIEKRLKVLCSTVRGTSASILPFICTKEGKFSDKKAKSFIEDLIGQRERIFNEQNRERDFTLDEKIFLKAFLYCTLRCFANERIKHVEIYEKRRICASFQDILDKAWLVDNDRRIKELNELCDLEFFNFEDYPAPDENPESSFFIAMDLCYERITGKSYKTLDEAGFDAYFHSDKYQKYLEREQQHIDAQLELEQSDAEKDILAQGLGFDSFAELEKEARAKGKDAYAYIDELSDIDYDNLSDDERENLFSNQTDLNDAEQYIKKLNAVRAPEWDAFFENFESPDEFIERYKDYRKLFFMVDHDGFYSKIEDMVYGYMYENDLSLFINNDATFSELNLIDDVNAQLNAAIERIRRKNGIS
jgi:hypothetical protein